MITTDDMYDLYSLDIKATIKDQKEIISTYTKSRNYFLSQLKQYEDVINNYCDIPFSEFAEVTTWEERRSLIKEIDRCYFPITRGDKLSSDDLSSILDKMCAINRLLHRATVSLERSGYQLRDSKVFKIVIRTFNKEMLKAILYKGYSFQLEQGISSLSVVKKKRHFKDEKVENLSTIHNNKVINWGESNKIKKEILASGGLPLKGNNGGIAWLVYYTNDVECWFYWKKKECMVLNHVLYSFVLCKGAKAELQVAKKDELAYASYVDYKPTGTNN